MNILRRYVSGFKADRLADLIVLAKPTQIRFRSEEHFFRLLGLPQNAVPVLIDDNRAIGQICNAAVGDFVPAGAGHE